MNVLEILLVVLKYWNCVLLPIFSGSQLGSDTWRK